MISQKSAHQLIRNTYNFETAHQKQTKQATRNFDRVLIKPINLNAQQKFTQSIQQMQSKIEGVENLMKTKVGQIDQNASDLGLNSRSKNLERIFEGSKNKVAANGNISAQDLRTQGEHASKSSVFSPIRKSYRLAEPKKYADESPIKIPPLNLHSICTPTTQHSVNHSGFSLASTSTSPSPPRKTINKFYHQSKSFMQLPPNEADTSFTLKLNGSFMNVLNEDERSNEINLFNAGEKKVEKERKCSKVIDESKGANDLSILSIKNTINKMRSRANTKQLSSKNIIEGFELGKVLGKGKFGEVYLAKHLQTGFLVAIKKIVKKKMQELKMVNQFINEVKLHSSLDHPTIVKFYGLIQQPDSFYIVMEYVNGGTLFDYQNEVGILSMKQAVEFLKDIIDALMYLHGRSIAHRDIKPENIVINSAGIAKLCDFGWSAVVESSRSTFCGTLDYAPPEIIERKSYDCTVDLWCIGILTYELFVGKAPFESENRNEVMQRIVNIDIQGIPMLNQIPAEAQQFIEALLQKDPTRRPRINQLYDFPLFSSISPSKLKKDRSFFK